MKRITKALLLPLFRVGFFIVIFSLVAASAALIIWLEFLLFKFNVILGLIVNAVIAYIISVMVFYDNDSDWIPDGS